jgi:hypothetical protein
MHRGLVTEVSPRGGGILVAEKVDPGAVRKTEKAAASGADTFEEIAREWWERFHGGWSETHASKVITRLEANVFPYIGAIPLAKGTAPEILAVLRRVESRKAIDLAHQVRRYCGQVFRFAIATGQGERDPAADLRCALAPVVVTHRSTITDPREVGAPLRAIQGFRGSFVTLCALRPAPCALRLGPLVFVRPGELRHAEWAEVDLDRAEWRIPGTWRIVWMDVWGQDFVDMEVPGHFTFREDGTGSFQFGLVCGEMDTQIQGNRIEFSWVGNDEMDEASGRGCAEIADGELRGHIFIHQGDDSAFRARKQ